MAFSRTSRSDTHPGHRDVAGGWLRPAVFGVMDGLVSNFALVAGVAGAGTSARVVLLAGLAGLFAGAFSMGTGEYASVRSQQELAFAEIEVERQELERHPEAERAELAGIYRSRGLTHSLADEVSRALSADPEVAWRVHAREELGIDPDNLPSPWLAAVVSFLCFGLGALVPLLPYLAGAGDLAFRLSAAAAAVGLFGAGALVGRFTSRSSWYTGTRQLVLGAAAALVTFGVGNAVGS